MRYRVFLLTFLIFSGLLLSGCKPGENVSSNNIDSTAVVISAKTEVSGPFKVGEAAPEFSLIGFDGEVFNSTDIVGQKPVLIDFWAGWCPFCLNEMPELQKAHTSFGDQLAILGVHRTDTESKDIGEKFAKEHGVEYLLLQDDGELYQAASGIGMPVAVLIDAQGVVTEIKSGPKTADQIKEKVQSLLLRE